MISASWGENYSIDPWGNLMISPMGGKAHGGNFQHAGSVNNQASGLGYDAAGNLTNYTAPGQYVYDPENRIQSTAGTTYTYDADGNRVEKSGGSVSTLYWYGAPGIIAESDLSGTLKSEYIFFNGKRLARIDLPAGTVHYYLSDHLNSTSMVVNGSGAVEDESDYSPFGTEYVVTGSGANHYKFTSKERDTESGLDYFGARFYSNGLARFSSADPIHFQASMLADPQRFNLYAYVRNNPLRLVDPDGKAVRLPDDNKKREEVLKGMKAAVGKQAGGYLYDNSITKTDANGKSTTEHYVGIYTNGPDGKGPSFASINQNAAEIGAVIGSQQVLQATTVSNGTVLTNDQGQHMMIGPIPNSPGATYMQNGQMHIAILEPAVDPGKLPGSKMSDGQPGAIDQGIMWSHEFGHAAIGMGVVVPGPSNDAAVQLENNVRQGENPNGPVRIAH